MIPMFRICSRLWTIFSASDVDLNFGISNSLETSHWSLGYESFFELLAAKVTPFSAESCTRLRSLGEASAWLVCFNRRRALEEELKLTSSLYRSITRIL